MADNDAQQGNSNIRTLDRSAIKTQIFGFDVAQSSESELLGLGDSRELIVTSAGLTTAATTYTAGDQMGTEITVASSVRTAKGLTIQSGIAIDKAKVLGSFDLYVFGAATTPAADNAANSWSDADMLNVLAILHFTDVITSANNIQIMCTNAPFTLRPASGTSLFFDFVTRTANGVFGAVGDIQVSLGVLRD